MCRLAFFSYFPSVTFFYGLDQVGLDIAGLGSISLYSAVLALQCNVVLDSAVLVWTVQYSALLALTVHCWPKGLDSAELAMTVFALTVSVLTLLTSGLHF